MLRRRAEESRTGWSTFGKSLERSTLSRVPSGWSSVAVAQGPKTMKGALYYCMKTFFPNFEIDHSNPNRGFDTASGHNFVYEGGRWIDTKTGQAVCPGPTGTGPKTMKGARYYCMKTFFLTFAIDPSTPNRAFDTASGNNSVS